MPSSKETRVRVEGFSKIIASALSASGFLSPFGNSPRFSALPASMIWRSVSARQDVEVEEMPDFAAQHSWSRIRHDQAAFAWAAIPASTSRRLVDLGLG